MPLIESEYKPHNPIFKNAHINTIYASLIRWIPKLKFERERIETPDGDFLDLDWSNVKSKKLILCLAGLEGKSNSIYLTALIKYFNNMMWDAVCMNYRGCSGQPNELLKGYHMGASDDLKTTIEYILETKAYEEIVIIGYSLGGNISLKYLGEEGKNVPQEIKASINFSVPMDLEKSSHRLSQWYNWHYLKYFMIPLNRKVNQKKKQFPGSLKDYKGFFMTGNFSYFDKYFTAPVNGFKTVLDYWNESSCKSHLPKINIPSLIIASKDDTFITDQCYPYMESKTNPMLYLEIAKYGGHCGFIRNCFEKVFWMEERALQFIQSHSK